MRTLKPVFLALLLAGCELSQDLEAEPLDDHASPEQPAFGPIDEGELAAPPQAPAVPVGLVVGDCPGATRLIGVLDPGHDDCTLGGTVPNDWVASRLFEAGSPHVAALSESVPAELERFCAYDFGGLEQDLVSGYAALISAVDTHADMDVTTLSADCRGEFEQANLYDPTIGAELRAAFMTNIGWTDGVLVDQTYDQRETIEVAVVDTVSQAAADDPNIDPTNAHGLQMAALIREVACPAERSDCVNAVRHELALPRDDWDTAPDWIVGGRHGGQGDLAMAIYAAVEGWRERRLADPNNSAPRLVVNLSIGWTRMNEEALLSERGPHASVLAAMRFASCHGALMFAAAGNTDDELCPDFDYGPLSPARFEALPAPSLLECTAWGYVPQWTLSHPVFALPGAYAPLVHAVGALDEFDEPLINSREGAMPRLAALGANGIADPSADALSGTSVSAALVSATAALLWSYRPELRPDEIAELIHDGGWDLGYNADFSLPNDTDPVRRLSVCAALEAACSGQGVECPTPGCSATAPALDGNLSAVADAIAVVLEDPQTNVDTIADPALREWPICDPELGPPLTDLVSPQPEIPLCSRCDLAKRGGVQANDDQLSMSIDTAYAGRITGVTLITSTESGERSYRTFGSAVIDSLNAQPDPVDVTVVLVDEPEVVSAALRFTLIDGSVQKNRITVTEIGSTTSP